MTLFEKITWLKGAVLDYSTLRLTLLIANHLSMPPSAEIPTVSTEVPMSHVLRSQAHSHIAVSVLDQAPCQWTQGSHAYFTYTRSTTLLLKESRETYAG